MIGDTKYIILDVPGADKVRDGVVGRLKEMFPRGSTFGEVVPLVAAALTESLMQTYSSWLWNILTASTTLVVFPGNGASIMRRYLPQELLRHWRWIGVTAKRMWVPGEDPRTMVGRIADHMLLGVKDIVIIDDVISSGETIRRIRMVNEPWIPMAAWHASAWVIQRNAGIRGFASPVIGNCAETVGTNERKAPVNSLSTLLEHREIAESYARRNFPNPEAFLAFLEELR